MANSEVADDRGLYCSTAGTYFTNKDALADHYKSEFHRWEEILSLRFAHSVFDIAFSAT